MFVKPIKLKFSERAGDALSKCLEEFKIWFKDDLWSWFKELWLAVLIILFVLGVIAIPITMSVQESKKGGVVICRDVAGGDGVTKVLFEGGTYTTDGWLEFYSTEMKQQIKTNLPCVVLYDEETEDK